MREPRADEMRELYRSRIVNYLLVCCADYNGQKNILFMMRADDDRVGTQNWTVLDYNATYKNHVLTTTRGRFIVHEDWSCSEEVR